tara:strand:+ start:390 stop:596 length:207 start_codon:yes stop_codon:yes gene_type:complete
LELQAMQASVDSIKVKQFTMSANFSDYTMVQHDDTIHVTNRRQSVGDNHRRAIFNQPVKSTLYLSFGL